MIDPDGVYDPRQVDDRVLLGLKGTMSEYELSLMRQRGLGARDAKAQRGELRAGFGRRRYAWRCDPLAGSSGAAAGDRPGRALARASLH